ncbi:putative Holin-X, holin superfamily III [Streptoalloteichus tenebrarius]|uniref:Holin-X, holin superfamily III n=1 Tax=Streptoalloteichus tenebrarius (strain ATCC 17920 / DSM 40477 / JCM 4838 / CBS 697.72 / NBRC 16177 / NCIMB 11028 / NRRL B-12390 / A12253. 1 / ISP 5477) TaxID=1933 RepID=A0ABT1HLH0_STRSD|nr:phage holin family protein [Streptoalloteichus tenebrarius]MCP2256353.1 putative Holin-X, holin superfamily III [Streptoalloteichus tenebrarius]BFF04693.1 phage holin family protein [Streptoalloteichus tenebrarius]
MTHRTAARPAESRSVAELVSDLTDQIRRLVRDEMRLAAVELRGKGRRLGAGAGLAGAAAVLAWYGGAALVAALVLVLALVMPAWVAALVVGVVLLLVGAVLGLSARQQVRRAGPPVPEEAVTGLRQDVETIKERARR